MTDDSSISSISVCFNAVSTHVRQQPLDLFFVEPLKKPLRLPAVHDHCTIGWLVFHRHLSVTRLARYVCFKDNNPHSNTTTSPKKTSNAARTPKRDNLGQLPVALPLLDTGSGKDEEALYIVGR